MTDAGKRPGHRSRLRLLVIATFVGALALAFTVGWALPNVAGNAFVDVRAVVVARPASDGPHVTIGGRSTVQARTATVAIEVTNRYPLPVVVAAGSLPYRLAAYRRDDAGQLVRVWQAGASDPSLEEGSDSPAGGGSAAGAASIASGTTRPSLDAASSTLPLVDSTGTPLAPGIYYVRVWAYGIGSPFVPIALDAGLDAAPSDLPSDVPAPTGSFDFH